MTLVCKISHELVHALIRPESFVSGGPTLITFFLVDEGKEDPNTT